MAARKADAPRTAASVAAILREVDLFSEMAPDVLQGVSLSASRRRWVPGQQVFVKGDPVARELFIILRGRVRLSMLSPAGRELSLRYIGTGEVLGEIAVLGGTPRTATATALSDVEALAFPADAIVRAISIDPATARVVMRLLCDRLRTTTEQLETVALYGLEARLARFFLRIAVERNGQAKATLALTQEQVAELIGASRSKVSQTFARMERVGAIQRTGARYALDITLLRALALGKD